MEAEVVAADAGVRLFGVPAQMLWEVLLDRPVRLVVHEDNQPAIMAMRAGGNPKLRHLKRTQKVCLGWLRER